ncbi:MAG TPA: NADAR family protein [Pseudonocardiaceae bacterium]|nr:NADAR family protein [Pseudonocardiaceae bacterium]
MDVTELVDRISAGERPDYLFFWGHHAAPGRAVGPWVFSQWWPATFVVDGREYPTAEHYMMTGKALLFGDEAIAAAIRSAATPREAKELGRQVANFDEQRWADRCSELVEAGNLAKFGQHPELRDYLLDTGDRVLVEASPVDRVWGIGLAADDPRAADPTRWRGRNLLGFALMQVRDRLSGCRS